MLSICFDMFRMRKLLCQFCGCVGNSWLPVSKSKMGFSFFFFSFIDWTPLCTVRSVCWYQSSKAPPRNNNKSKDTLIMITSVPLHHCHTHNHSKDALWLYCLLPLLVPQCVTSSNIYLEAETCPTWKTGLFTDLWVWGLKRAGSTHIQNLLGEDWIPFAGNGCLLFERRVAEIPAVLSASRLISIIDVVL